MMSPSIIVVAASDRKIHDGILLNVYRRRLTWLYEELLELIRDLTPEQMLVEPNTGRLIYRILEHAAGAQCAYLRTTVGKVEGLSDALKAVERGPEAQ